MTQLLSHASRRDRFWNPNPVTLRPWAGVELQIGEARRAVEEAEVDRTYGTVAMLGDDDLGDALLLRVILVLVFPIDEDNDVRILLNRARLSQVGKHRPVIGAALYRVGELRQGDHRHIQLACQALQPA